MVTEKHIHRYNVCIGGFKNCNTVSEYNKNLILNFIEKKGNKTKTREFPYSYSSMRINCLKWLSIYSQNKDLDKLTHEELLVCSRELIQTDKWKKQYKKKWCAIINSFFTFICGRDANKLKSLIYDDENDKIFDVGRVERKDKKEKVILTYDEVEKLILETSLPHYAYFFSVMFDGGMRIEEFLRIKFKNFKLKKEQNQEYYELDVGYSDKSKGKFRTIALTMYPNVIKTHLENRKKEIGRNYNEDCFVFNHTTINADSICNKFIKKEIKKILNKENSNKYHNHSFRSSSATYYYCDLNFSDALLEARFAWEPNSPERREYVQLRNNISKKQVSEMRIAHIKVRTDEITYEFEDYKKQTENEKTHLKKEIVQLKNDFNNLLHQYQYDFEQFKKEVTNLFAEITGDFRNEVNFEFDKNKKLFDFTSNVLIYDIKDETKSTKLLEQLEVIDSKEYNTTEPLKIIEIKNE